jgi:hypothetical protein
MNSRKSSFIIPLGKCCNLEHLLLLDELENFSDIKSILIERLLIMAKKFPFE